MTLPTLLAWAETQHMGISTCPLCTSFAPEDSPELVNHVLKHVYEFSMRALPWPIPIEHDDSQPLGTFVLPEEEEEGLRLVTWAEDVDFDSYPVLQFSSFDDHAQRKAQDTDTDTVAGDDPHGYVLPEDYFDEASSDNSSQLQPPLTERSQLSVTDAREDNDEAHGEKEDSDKDDNGHDSEEEFGNDDANLTQLWDQYGCARLDPIDSICGSQPILLHDFARWRWDPYKGWRSEELLFVIGRSHSRCGKELWGQSALMRSHNH